MSSPPRHPRLPDGEPTEEPVPTGCATRGHRDSHFGSRYKPRRTRRPGRPAGGDPGADTRHPQCRTGRMPERCRGAITISAQGTRRPRTSDTQTQDKAINHESSTTPFCPREGIHHFSSSASPFREEIHQETGQRQDAQERLNKTLAATHHANSFLSTHLASSTTGPRSLWTPKKKI